jgi:hypothetical protein
MCPPSLVGVGGEVSGAGFGAAWPEQRDGRPAVAGGDRAVGAEAIAERVELFRGRGWFELPGEGVALTDAEVVDGPDVEAAQLEHQVHLGGPAADGAYGYEPGDQFLVAAFGGPREDERSVEDFGGKVAERGELVRGQTGSAECRVGCRGQRRGRQCFADRRS